MRSAVLEHSNYLPPIYSMTPIEWVRFAENKPMETGPAEATRADHRPIAVRGLINVKLSEAEAEQLLCADIQEYGEEKINDTF